MIAHITHVDDKIFIDRDNIMMLVMNVEYGAILDMTGLRLPWTSLCPCGHFCTFSIFSSCCICNHLEAKKLCTVCTLR